HLTNTLYYLLHPSSYLFLYTLLPPPTSTLFPYTTLFRSSSTKGVATSFDVRRRTELCRPVLICLLLVCSGLLLRDEPSPYPAARSEETRLNSSHLVISYAVFCLKKKKKKTKYTYKKKIIN